MSSFLNYRIFLDLSLEMTIPKKLFFSNLANNI